MKAKDFDKLFDEGKDIIEQLNLSESRKPNLDTKRVNVDFPEWMVRSLGLEPRRLGVSRQSVIKIWLAERMEKV